MNTHLVPAIALALALATTPGAVSATPTTAPIIESYAVRGSSIERIRASTVIDAPIDRVRAVLFDYAHYPEFMPMYEKANVVWTTPEGLRLVHMQLRGLVKLWMRVEISPPTVRDGIERYAGRLVQGNVKAFETRWELEGRGDKTRLTVESFLDPDLPLVPSGLVNSGARDGVRDAMVALKAHIEGKPAR
jgi:ribosome-associated toxin RatA of RatAB toxin-antitoxin module